MNWDEMRGRVAACSFFEKLSALRPEQLAARVRWAPLFTTDRLQRWLDRDCEWVESALAVPQCEEALYLLLSVLLERHLLNLDTRFDPEPLFAFWDRAVRSTGCTRPVATVWRDNERSLRESCGTGKLILRNVVAQERTFAKLLRDAETVLRDAPGNLRWAADTVARLAARRAFPDVRGAQARVVFAWEEHQCPTDFRPALLADFELGAAGEPAPFVDPETVFDAGFRGAVEYVADTLVGRRQFHHLRLRAHPVYGPVGADPTFTAGTLTGESGGLAIYLAQLLANRATGRFRKLWYALPPWVVATATLDRNTGRVGPVGAIGAKLRLLREEGVRVVAVAEESAQLTAVDDALKEFGDRHGVVVVPVDDPRATADELVRRECARPTDIPKPAVVGRRAFLLSTALAATVGMAGVYAANRPARTVAMKRHDLNLMRKTAREVKEHIARHGPKSYHRDVLGAIEKPAQDQLSFRGLQVLADGKFFDCTDWEPVPSLTELARAPIEPTYYTRVLRLRKRDGAPRYVTSEFNTTGFGVVPLLDPARPNDRVFVREREKSAGVISKTASLRIDISDLGNGGEPFDLVIRAVWFNGAQEQRLWGKEHDWWGHRVDPRTERADLAVRLPGHKPFGAVQRVATEFPRTHGTEKVEPTPLLVDPHTSLWAPADETPDVTYTKGTDSVWVIPRKSVVNDDTWWVYAIKWRWTG